MFSLENDRKTSPGFTTTSSCSVTTTTTTTTTTESRVSEVSEVVELYTRPQYRCSTLQYSTVQYSTVQYTRPQFRLPEPTGTGDYSLGKRSLVNRRLRRSVLPLNS